MRADSVARLTLAVCTPGTRNKAFSTRPTQEAQVMPPMPMSRVHCAAALGEGMHLSFVVGQIVSGRRVHNNPIWIFEDKYAYFAL
jgi:hypothetical protein